MSFDFVGKRVVIAGGSRGIGRSTALSFAQAGASLSVCARDPVHLASLKAELAESGQAVHTASCDLASSDAPSTYIEQAARALGGIDVLINCASGFGGADDERGWKASLDVDLLGTVRLSHAALPFLKRSVYPSIVNFASISALRPSKRTPPYGAIKAAIVQYTTSQALILAPHRVRVNCVAPGSIEFPGGVWEKRKVEEPELYQQVLATIPFGRLGHPEEVSSAVLFLASDQARWITGHTLVVDGGQMLT